MLRMIDAGARAPFTGAPLTLDTAMSDLNSKKIEALPSVVEAVTSQGQVTSAPCTRCSQVNNRRLLSDSLPLRKAF